MSEHLRLAHGQQEVDGRRKKRCVMMRMERQERAQGCAIIILPVKSLIIIIIIIIAPRRAMFELVHLRTLAGNWNFWGEEGRICGTCWNRKEHRRT
jgi:hypothetical protein